MKILVADDLPASALDLLHKEGWDIDARTGRTPEQLAHDLKDADAIMVRSATRVTSSLIDAAVARGSEAVPAQLREVVLSAVAMARGSPEGTD